MKKIHLSSLLALALTLFMAVSIIPASAQDKPADNMQIVREKIRADKKLLVSEVMQLTETEAKAFWPVYDAYQKELGNLAGRAKQLIDYYARNYKSMTDEAAKKLLDDHLTIQADRLKLMQNYRPKFEKALPHRKLARYYQLENKINSLVNFELAANIPLVN